MVYTSNILCIFVLQKVPEGDWFCEQCKPKEKTPRKRRKLYTEESMEDQEAGDR